ncbi:iron transporter [Halopiger aswanensis]|uniref:Fe2+ transport protein n=1 Tax=Halopiger aswanensis TaxID=148449 RepID=A0A419WP58_9EURY|nr:iron transporter [Halopiger aswanensis]RKD97232.1 Fe2+ transport protein [Halopiger aswanensis]
MRRRDVLRLGAIGTVSGAALGPLAGCLESLEREDAWRRLVVDPPDGVYVPPKRDEMVPYGSETIDGREITALATRPHSFWTVTGDERTRADLHDDHSLHLMVRVRDVATNAIVPTSVSVTVRRNGERVDRRTLWPMLSQRMGFHYGDNVALAGDGSYEATVRVGGADCRTADPSADRLGQPATATFALEFSREEIESLERTLVDADERDDGDALEPMEPTDEDRDRPAAVAPSIESFPGDPLTVETGGDVRFPAVVVDGVPAITDGPYLAVVPQTAYNGYVLPFASLSVTGRSGERTMIDEPTRETIAPELGHHYGLALEGLGADRIDDISFTLEPPQVARHEGYETAFLEHERVQLAFDGDRLA